MTLLGLGCGTESTPQKSVRAAAPTEKVDAGGAPKVDWTQIAKPKATPPPTYEDFVGAETCLECHQDKDKTWRRSAHGQAGGLPGEETIVPSFDGQVITMRAAQVIPRINQGRYEFLIRRPGQYDRRFRVTGVIGKGLMAGGGGQTFLVQGPEGRQLTFPIEYNVNSNRWYCQLASTGWTPLSTDVSLGDCGWPPSRAVGFTPGASCGNCHASQLQVEFDESAGGYHTQIKSLAINCESCHGPGKKHVSIMRNAGANAGEDIGMEPLDLLSKQRSMLVCMACHVNKVNISPGYLAAGDFDAHLSAHPIWDPNERKDHFDGRVVNFGYQQGHLYSDCFLNGSMTCVDCHDPHSLTYRDPFGKSLPGRFDDGQCVGCHAAKADGDHTKHQPGTEGAKCTSCHMPLHQHATVGDTIQHRRSDHAIPIPRPTHDDGLGIVGACKGCHSDKPLQWREEKVAQLWGRVKPMHPLVKGLFEAVPGQAAPHANGDLERLVAQRADSDHVVSVVALSLMIGELLKSHKRRPDEATRTRLYALTKSTDLDIASAAFTALLFFEDGDSKDAPNILRALQSREEDWPRIRRKIVYNFIGIDHAYGRLSPEIRRRIRQRIESVALPISDGSQGIRAALGASYSADSDHEKAIEYFEQTGRGPLFETKKYSLTAIGHRGNVLELLADAHGARGQIDVAEKKLAEAARLAPRNDRLLKRICQRKIQSGQLVESERCVADLMANNPEFLEGYFVRADLLIRMGRSQEAKTLIDQGLKLMPEHQTGLLLRKKITDTGGR